MKKLFSYHGAHSSEKTTKVRVINTSSALDKLGHLPLKGKAYKELIAFAGMMVYAAVLCVWMLSGVEAPSAVESGTAYIAETVQLAETPAAEVAEIVTIDQTEALAMGIDAVISSECDSEWVSDTTMVMVANVILNRTNDSRYPDTVDQVLTQPYQFSCFSTAGLKWLGRAANDMAFRERCMTAAEAAMNGERLLNYGVVYVSSGKQGTVEAQLDNLYFCK